MAKTRIVKLEVGIRKCEKALAKFEANEAKARKRWTIAYHSFLKATADLAGLKRFNTLRHENLRKKVIQWPEKSVELTRKRDETRMAIAEQKVEIARQSIELSTVMVKEKAEQKAVDDLVEQVHLLNNGVITALEIRNHYLSSHVYGLMVDEKGNLRSQLTWVNSDQTKKVVALVNTIQLVLPDLADQAMEKIRSFFGRFQAMSVMDEAVQAMHDLTKELLVEKMQFRVGPNLYRFLSLELDQEIFPELRIAQDLLKRSIRSEKTNTYIRLYKRASRADNWEPIRQT